MTREVVVVDLDLMVDGRVAVDQNVAECDDGPGIGNPSRDIWIEFQQLTQTPPVRIVEGSPVFGMKDGLAVANHAAGGAG